MLALSLLSAAFAGTLAEAWQAAEDHGTELPLAHEQRLQSDATRTQSWSLLSPKVVLGADYTINEYEIALDFMDMIPEELAPLLGDATSDPIVLNKKQYLQWNASVVQPIFSPKGWAQFAAAGPAVKAGREAESGQRSAIKQGIAAAYYGVVVAREGEKIATSALESARAHQKLAEQQVAVGVAPPTAKLQAEIAVSRAARDVASAQEGRAKAEEGLARLTGWSVDEPVSLPEPPTLPYAASEAAEERSLTQRPDVLAAVYRERAARYGRWAADLDWLPTLDGRFTYSYNENTGFSDDKTMWMVVFSAKWTLWDGGARIGAQQAAASQRRMATLAAERARDVAAEDVRKAWKAWETSAAALTAVEHESELARENLRLSEVAFQAGSITFLDLEDARLGARASELARLQQRMTRDLAALSLLATTGDL